MNAENGDKAGPVGIAATVTTAAPPPPDPEKKDSPPAPPQTRIAVFGDSDFASNAVGNSVGNADLFLNTISWLTAQENLISIRPREPGDSRLSHRTVADHDGRVVRGAGRAGRRAGRRHVHLGEAQEVVTRCAV